MNTNQSERRTRWGGRLDNRVQARGFFRTARLQDVWWLVDPDGGLFLSKGVCTVRIDQDRVRNSDRIPYQQNSLIRYGSVEAWRAAVAARLAGWGVNTLGAWSDPAVAVAGPAPFAFTINLDLGHRFAFSCTGPDTPWGDPFPDPFEPGFETACRARAEEQCAPHRDDPAVLGWFADNELRWGPDWRGDQELLTLFLNLPHSRAGRLAAVDFLRQRHGEFAAFERIWRTDLASWEELAAHASAIVQPYPRRAVYDRRPAHEAALNRADPVRALFIADCDDFAGVLAERYFAITGAAIRAAAPNHLVLGCRFHYVPQAGVLTAAGRHLDVVSFNCYQDDPVEPIDAYATCGKPGLIGEFSFRGDDAGLPNSRGASPRVATQAMRAEALRRYVVAALGRPSLVGYHWFEHADQPVEGRADDGEDSNYGTVTITNDVYAEVTAVLQELNTHAEAMHANAAARGAAVS